MICKNTHEAEIWIAGLNTLISSAQDGRSKIDGLNDGGLYFDESGELTSVSSNTSSISTTLEISSPEVCISSNTTSSPKNHHLDNSARPESSDVVSEQTSMLAKGPASDALRFSISSVPSTSSQDDCDALGNVYIWGEVICDNVIKLGPDKNTCSVITTRKDVLLPKPLECNVVLDVHHIACGVRHAAIITRQGEVFSWGEENGGRLGHGVGKDITLPRLVESLSCVNVNFIACGEFHTCAVTNVGELYTWGDGMHNAGLLGHGTNVGHWMRVLGPLEGIQVAVVACGPWHTALITSTGRLFTFGDGNFGVLGHGNMESVLYPKEVESLSGLRTVAVACGVWHTAAIIEVIATQLSTSIMSGKLFTWGDGDKNRLGQGDKEHCLKPTCVPALIDHNFHKIACGHSLTIGLTTSGRVFTMGSPVYGQLGNPRSDWKLPCPVEGKLLGEIVEEIVCGAYHVAVMTSKNEVYTWGKGGNGSLGHGDIEDKKTPTLVEALKDKHVKFIACGSNYMSAVCIHKWVSGAEQSQCSSCRQAFGFTRKRHNCYNCGLVHCHACTSRKAIGAALAPNSNKTYRVCDSCFAELTNKGVEVGEGHTRRNSIPRLSSENKDHLDRTDLRSAAKSAMPSNSDLIRQLDTKAAKQGKRSDTFSFDLQMQVESHRKQCELQELELKKSMKEAEEAMVIAGEEFAKCRAAKKVIRSLTAQLKDMAGRLHPGSYNPEGLNLVKLPNGIHYRITRGERNPNSDAINGFHRRSHSRTISGASELPDSAIGYISSSSDPRPGLLTTTIGTNESATDEPYPDVGNSSSPIESEWIEQYEPGVYLTLVALQDGTRDLRRVRFSRRRFGEHQAETWWSENRKRVYEKHNVRGSSLSTQAAARRSEGAFSHSSQI
ncbi:hypothetical protein OROMI_031997 [Orobanche minor]